ncbi:phosphoglycerate dehydrogenase [Mycobacterium sp. MS1601]|uniref:2-hydroxyacid dehydrogenase n=1 Tax=Mycobacterium sp. MS1601 TaxID=1936029 RepID=UPI0009793520|nr:2-hydroxyacid dehydrogenase [Mycobacterium sp. MS1601]AQA03256.1 phosphoglycerate dehydrogenase [Mycobacterium sp. MS1601]
MKVLVPDDLGMQILGSSQKLAPVRYEAGQPWPEEHLDTPVVVVDFFDAPATGRRFADLPELRLVQTLHAGYEQWRPFVPSAVMLSNGRGAHGGSTAEWVVAVLLDIYRELPLFAGLQAAGTWGHRTSDTLIGKRIVVLGAGDLGTNLAARLAPFEVEVTLVGRTARPGVHALADVDNLLPDADAVVAMLPDAPATRHIVDAGFLARMRDGAVLVNAGRGSAVDTDALLVELRSGRLRAALDVTDPEPLPDGHPLWSAPGLLLTPHVAGSTAGAEERAWRVALRQITAFADGEVPPNRV